MSGFIVITAFLGFIFYIIFTLYEESKERDYSIKNKVIKRKQIPPTKQIFFNPAQNKNPWEEKHNPWKIKHETRYKEEPTKDINRWKRPEPEKNIIGERWTIDFLKCLEWKRYEDVCMEYLRIKNCNAFVTCTGADGGIDITIKDSKGTIFAIGQCKSWKRQIGVNLIREIYGVMAAEKARVGIFLTTSTYSVEAQAFAQNKALVLIDAEELVKLINGLDEVSRKRIDKAATKGDFTTPTCVQCNEKMVKRIAKHGNNKGGQFWGCVNYPKCKITMKVR